MDMKIKPISRAVVRKPAKLLFSLFIVALTGSGICQQGISATTLDKIAAVVDNDLIMLTEVYRQAKQLKTQKAYASLPDKALHKEALELLIQESLQIQKAQQLGLTVGDTALNAAMEDLAKQNRLTLAQFQVALKREGINYREFREQIRRRLVVNELRKRQLQRNTNVTNQEVNDLIANQSASLSKGTEYKMHHILIPAPAGTDLPVLLQAKEKAWTLRSQLLKGTDPRFNNSKKASAWTPADQLSRSQLRHITLLEVGQISEVFQDSKGFHLIKLVAKRGAKKAIVNEFRARHILLKTKPGSNNHLIKNKLAEIRHKILAGASFSTLAKVHSQDPGSGSSGGDLGWADADSYVPEFANALKNTPVNKISQPFHTKFGWHIVQVLETKNIDKTEELLRDQAKGLLNKNKAKKDYNSWVKQLRNDAFVEYRINLNP